MGEGGAALLIKARQLAFILFLCFCLLLLAVARILPTTSTTGGKGSANDSNTTSSGNRRPRSDFISVDDLTDPQLPFHSSKDIFGKGDSRSNKSTKMSDGSENETHLSGAPGVNTDGMTTIRDIRSLSNDSTDFGMQQDNDNEYDDEDLNKTSAITESDIEDFNDILDGVSAIVICLTDFEILLRYYLCVDKERV